MLALFILLRRGSAALLPVQTRPEESVRVQIVTMDMNSLIHHHHGAASPQQPFPSYSSTGLPGLRTHFPSLPVFRPPGPESQAMEREQAMEADRTAQPDRRRTPATTLAPLRFIIPSSHCNSSMNAYANEPLSYRPNGTLAMKMEPKEDAYSRSYAQVESEHVGLAHMSQASEGAYRSSCNEDFGYERAAMEADDAKEVKPKVKKTAAKRTRTSKNSNRSTKSKARPGLRKGKWTDEESRYATQLTNYFKEGLLPIERGTMLRLYLSQKLNCEPMRITKKFTGGECIGKQVFRPCSPTPESRVRLMQANLELVALEAAFLRRLKENREEAPESTSVDVTEEDLGEEKPSQATSRQATKRRSNDEDAEDDGFTSESSASSDEAAPSAQTNVASGVKTQQGEDEEDANAVGLLLDFFYKANRTTASSSTNSSSKKMAAGLALESKELPASPSKRIRTLSISSHCVEDAASTAKRSRVGSFICAPI